MAVVVAAAVDCIRWANLNSNFEDVDRSVLKFDKNIRLTEIFRSLIWLRPTLAEPRCTMASPKNRIQFSLFVLCFILVFESFSLSLCLY